MQSCLGLRAHGFEVFLLEDCIVSNEANIGPALRRMQMAGLVPTQLQVLLLRHGTDRGLQSRPQGMAIAAKTARQALPFHLRTQSVLFRYKETVTQFPPPTIPVQSYEIIDGSMSFPSPSNLEHDRAPTDGQACILDGSGEVIWTNESWRRNESPLPMALTIGGNYCTACSENRSSIVDASKLEAALENLLESTTEYFDLEIACIAPKANSSKRPYSCLIRAQAIAIDGKRCVMLSHEDVTAARLANAALHASEDRYRQFFEAAPDAVFLLSGSPEDAGRILDANTKAAESHGYTRDELLTMSIGDLDVQEDAQLVKQRVASLFEKGSITFKVTHRRRDGSEFPVEVSARTTTVGGKPCIVAFNRDISERQDFEDALRENKLRIDLAARASHVGFWHWD
ncbi:MAG: PAS domain S-box-containing protein, partial [Candidatus Azotimanducaceae bacterium]